EGGHEREAIWGEYDVCRESKTRTVQAPRIRRVSGVEQFHRRGTDILQLDEFIVLRRRVIMDFVNDGRAKTRATVRSAEGRGDLRHQLLNACAVHVAPEGHAFRCAAKAETVAVPGEVCVRVP